MSIRWGLSGWDKIVEGIIFGDQAKNDPIKFARFCDL
jgi:hypothetical protein